MALITTNNHCVSSDVLTSDSRQEMTPEIVTDDVVNGNTVTTEASFPHSANKCLLLSQEHLSNDSLASYDSLSNSLLHSCVNYGHDIFTSTRNSPGNFQSFENMSPVMVPSSEHGWQRVNNWALLPLQVQPHRQIGNDNHQYSLDTVSKSNGRTQRRRSISLEGFISGHDNCVLPMARENYSYVRDKFKGSNQSFVSGTRMESACQPRAHPLSGFQSAAFDCKSGQLEIERVERRMSWMAESSSDSVSMRRSSSFLSSNDDDCLESDWDDRLEDDVILPSHFQTHGDSISVNSPLINSSLTTTSTFTTNMTTTTAFVDYSPQNGRVFDNKSMENLRITSELKPKDLLSDNNTFEVYGSSTKGNFSDNGQFLSDFDRLLRHWWTPAGQDGEYSMTSSTHDERNYFDWWRGHDIESRDLSYESLHLLCAERVSQMTKTYNDIEAVTRLLEEKERDLELAARIGQTLLSKNKDLSTKAETLEEQLNSTNERVNQLRHDLSTKNELLRFYTEDLENETSSCSTPSEEEKGKVHVNLEFLQSKVLALEDDNLQLRNECAELKTATESYEEKEKRLVEDCVKQLAEVNSQVEAFSQELQHKTEESSYQKEEINALLMQITERQKKINQLTLDNLDLHEKLTLSTESQKKLTKELSGMQDRYDELFEKLEETQDELCVIRSKQKMRPSPRHHHSAYSIPTDSLASELESCLQQELSQSNQRAQSWKIFETAKAAKRAIAKASTRYCDSQSVTTAGSVSSHGQKDSDLMSNISNCPSDLDSTASDGYSADMDSVYESNSELGRPGIPGSSDLESALRTLALKPLVDKNLSVESEEEILRKKLGRLNLSHSTTTSGRVSPGGASTTSSLPGYSSGIASVQGNNTIGSGHGQKFTDKLQIVKPLEGSMTLRHWQQLATPHLGGIFEQREGVQMKGEKKMMLTDDNYSLSDFEEDDDPCGSQSSETDTSHFACTEKSGEPISQGLGALLDPRAPSPGFISFKNSSTMSNSPEPLRTSSPKCSTEGTDSAKAAPSISLGLAELLSNGNKTGITRTLMHTSSMSAKRGACSTSMAVSTHAGTLINQSVLLSRSVNSLPQASSSSSSTLPSSHNSSAQLSTKFKNLPGSRSLEEVSVCPSGSGCDSQGSFSIASEPSKNPKHFVPGMTGQGFLQQLKNRGYSLYGLWSGSKDTSVSSSTDGEPNSAFGMAHARRATGIELGSCVVDEEDASKVSADNILPPGSGTGVLGALTNLRRGGLL